MTPIDILLEGERRGILTPYHAELLREARRRNMAPGPLRATEEERAMSAGDYGAGIAAAAKRGLAALGEGVQFAGRATPVIGGVASLLGIAPAIKESSEAMEKESRENLPKGLIERERERQRLAAAAGAKSGEYSRILPEGVTYFKQTVTDPALLLSFLAEQAPALGVQAGIAQLVKRGATARGVREGMSREAAEQAAIKPATTAALASGVGLQTASVGSETEQEAYKLLLAQGVPPDEAAARALAYGRQGAAGAGAISLASQFLPGGRSLERALAGQTSKLGMLGGAIRGGVAGVPSETVEEGGGAAFKNLTLQPIDPTRSLMDGVGEAVGAAAVGSLTMGGAAGALTARGAPTKQGAEADIARYQQIQQERAAQDVAAQQAEAAQREAWKNARMAELGQLTDDELAQFRTTLNERRKAEPPGEGLHDLNSLNRLAREEFQRRREAAAQQAAAPEVAPEVAPVETTEGVTPVETAEGVAPEVAPEAAAPEVAPEAAAPTAPKVDPLYDQAVAAVQQSGKVSVSALQRQFRLGYNRATRLVEQMERAGVVSPPAEDGVRKVVVPEAPTAEAPKVETPPEEVPGALTEDEVRGIAESNRKSITSYLPWFRKNVIGRTPAQVRELTTADPTLLEGKTARAQVLRTIIAEAKPEPTDVATDAERGTDQSGVEVPVGTGQERGAAGVPEGTGAPVGGRLERPTDEAGVGDVPAPEVPAALDTLSDEQLDAAYNAALGRHSAIIQQRQALKTSKGRIPSKNSPARAQYDALSEAAPRAQAEARRVYAEKERREKAAAPAARWNDMEDMPFDKLPKALQERWAKAVAENKATGELAAQIADDAAIDQETQAKPKGKRKGKGPEEEVVEQQYREVTDKEEDLTPEEVQFLKDNNLSAAFESIIDRLQGSVQAALAERLQFLLVNTNVIVQKDLKNDKGEPILGASNINGTGIWLDSVGGMNVETLLHEGIHAATERLLRVPRDQLTERQREAIKELEALWDAAKKNANIPLTKAARESLNEFMAESLSSRIVQKALDAEPWQASTYWESFKSILLRIMGVKTPKTMSDSAAQALDALFVAVKPAPAGVPSLPQVPQQQRPQPLSPALQSLLNSLPPQQRTGARTLLNNTLPGMTPTGQIVQEASRLTKFRTRAADRAATLMERLTGQFNRGVANSVQALPEQVQYRQAEAAGNLLTQFFKQGSLRYDPQLAQYRVYENPEVPSTAAVFDKIKQWGDARNLSTDEASQKLSDLFEAARLREMVRSNTNPNPASRTNFSIHREIPWINANAAIYDADPVVQEMVRMMDTGRKALIDQMVAAGRITRQEGQDWKDAVAYVPFDRQAMDTAFGNFRKHRRAGTGLAQLGKLPELKGSIDRPINNVFENHINVMGWMVDQTVKNKANVRTLLELKRMGYAAQYPPDSYLVKQNRERAVITYIDGAPTAFILPSVYDAMAFVDNMPPLQGFFEYLGKISHVLRTAITALPTFSTSQIVQDVQRAAAYSGITDVAALTGRALENFASVSMSEVAGKEHPAVKLFGSMGIVGQVDWTEAEPAKALLQELKVKPRGRVREAIYRLEAVSRAADLSVRKAIYEQSLAEGASELQAIYRAREFINFRRKGAGWRNGWYQSLARTVAFFNAYVQGMDVLYRTLSGKEAVSGADRKQALKMLGSRAMIMLSLGMLYAMGSSGDDEYDNMTLRERDRSWVLGNGLSLPAPTELAMIFKAIPERIWDYMRRHGTPEEQRASVAVSSWLKAAGEEYAGRMIPIASATRPVLETWMNYSFFTGRPIVGKYQSELPGYMQGTSRTSEFAKTVSQWTLETLKLDVSAADIDHLMQGYLGTTAAIVTSVLDAAINPDRADRPLHQIVGITPFTYNRIGTQRKDEFYELAEKVNKAKAAVDKLSKGNPEIAEKFYNENKDKYELYAAIASTLQQYKDTRAFINWLDSADSAKSYTQDERRNLREQAQRYEIELARWVREYGKNID